MRRLLITLILAAAACASTTGRELRAPTATTLPPQAGTVRSTTSASTTVAGFTLTSPDFVSGGPLPSTVGQANGNRSPALRWRAVPNGVTELALAVTDAARTQFFWLITGITPGELSLPAGSTPAGATVLPNSRGVSAWSGPTAEPGTRVELEFVLFALVERPALPTNKGVAADLAALTNASLTDARLTGTFSGPTRAGG